MKMMIEEVIDVLEIATASTTATGVTCQVSVEETLAGSPSSPQTPTSSDEVVELWTSAVARGQVTTL